MNIFVAFAERDYEDYKDWVIIGVYKTEQSACAANALDRARRTDRDLWIYEVDELTLQD